MSFCVRPQRMGRLRRSGACQRSKSEPASLMSASVRGLLVAPELGGLSGSLVSSSAGSSSGSGSSSASRMVSGSSEAAARRQPAQLGRVGAFGGRLDGRRGLGLRRRCWLLGLGCRSGFGGRDVEQGAARSRLGRGGLDTARCARGLDHRSAGVSKSEALSSKSEPVCLASAGFETGAGAASSTGGGFSAGVSNSDEPSSNREPDCFSSAGFGRSTRFARPRSSSTHRVSAGQTGAGGDHEPGWRRPP